MCVTTVLTYTAQCGRWRGHTASSYRQERVKSASSQALRALIDSFQEHIVFFRLGNNIHFIMKLRR